MRGRTRGRIAVVWCVVASIALWVAGASPARAEKRWYAGLRVGQADLAASEFGDVTQAGALFGWHLYRGPGGNIAVEAEYTTTTSRGEIDLGGVALGSPKAEWDLDTLGVYAAYRTGGLFYLKARAGYVDGSADVRATGAPIALRVDAGPASSVGVGFGWRFAKLFALEAEWTRSFFEQELDVVTVGVNF